MDAWVYTSTDNRPTAEIEKTANKPGSGVTAFCGPVLNNGQGHSLAESLRAIATQIERGGMTARKLVVVLEVF